VRVAELCSLKLDDYLKGECDIITKGQVSRHIIFNETCKKYVDEYLLVRKGDINNLFVSNQGTPMCGRSLNNTLKVIAKRAGISEDISNHTLRHSLISNLCNDYGIQAASRFISHSSVRITERYCHNTNAEISKMANSIQF
ncbi:MAG: hypothetical protein EOM50_14300, partial [Erysipelotrichia bacterium]|nr:hypothetical protein [Erysipelotrichia bacterium]